MMNPGPWDDYADASSAPQIQPPTPPAVQQTAAAANLLPIAAQPPAPAPSPDSGGAPWEAYADQATIPPAGKDAGVYDATTGRAANDAQAKTLRDLQSKGLLTTDAKTGRVTNMSLQTDRANVPTDGSAYVDLDGVAHGLKQDDLGLGIYTHAIKPLDRAAEGAEWLASKAGLDTGAINRTLGMPSAADATAGHLAYENEQAAQGKRPSWVGNVAGDVIGGLPTLPFKAGVGGAIAGVLEGDSKDLPHMLGDAAWGAVGGKLAEGAVGAVKRAVLPKLSPVVQDLINRGLKLTPGQIAEDKGAAGVLAKLSTLTPVAGELKRSAENKALDSFPPAFANEVLSPLGVTVPKGSTAGYGLNKFVKEAAEGAYKPVEAAAPVNLLGDDTYLAGMAGLKDSVEALPTDLQGRFGSVVRREIGGRVNPQTGTMSARGILDAKASLNAEIADYSGQGVRGYDRDYGQAVRGLKDHLLGALDRSSPEASQALKAADQTWGRYQIYKDAATRAPGAVNLPEGSFTPTHALAAIDSASPETLSMTGDAPMQDFVKKAQTTLSRNYQQPLNWTHIAAEAPVTLGVASSDLLGHHPVLATGAAAALSAANAFPALNRTIMTARPRGAAEVAAALAKLTKPAVVVGGANVARVADRFPTLIPSPSR